MKTTNLSLLLFGALLIFTSCQKVIDVDLNEGHQQFVIEANIVNNQPCVVEITKTVNFDESNFPGVTNATVTLDDGAGNSEILEMDSGGLYTSAIMKGVEGKTYTLNVKIDGETFQAVSTLPYKINLDSVWVDSLSAFGTTSFSVYPMYRDEIGVKNYYRFKLFINDTLDKNIFVEDDAYTDGRTVELPLFGEHEIKRGNTLRLQMMNIDKPTYLYFFSLASVQNGSNGAPANPVNNFSGHCLGYFSAHTLQEKSLLVK